MRFSKRPYLSANDRSPTVRWQLRCTTVACLLTPLGWRIVYTPYAELYHLESGSISDRTWNPAEAQYMRDTWGDVIARDPYYNPNLTRAFPDYRLPE